MNEKRPNVVFVLTDDQGYGDLGCTGNPDIQTPQIDEFYKEAVRLTDYHVAPLCAPTRGAIFTGRRPLRNGVWAPAGEDPSFMRGKPPWRRCSVTTATLQAYSANGI